MNADKYTDHRLPIVYRLEAIDDLKVLYTQLDKLISSLNDDMVLWNAILCLKKVMELQYQLETTFARLPVLGFKKRDDIAATVYEAKSLLKQHGNA